MTDHEQRYQPRGKLGDIQTLRVGSIISSYFWSHAGILVYNSVCPMLFSVLTMQLSDFRPALQPEILSSQIRTGNCCRVVVITHSLARTRRVLFGALGSIRIRNKSIRLLVLFY